MQKVKSIAIEKFKKKKERDYCALITVDVKNAFNTVSCKEIITALQDMKVP